MGKTQPCLTCDGTGRAAVGDGIGNCLDCFGRGFVIPEKPDTPGPMEAALVEQIKAGAWYVKVDTNEELARLWAEVGERRNKRWRTVSEGNSPPPWADLMFHGVPLVAGSVLIKCDPFIEALDLMKEALEKGTSIDLNVRLRDFLTRMRVPCRS